MAGEVDPPDIERGKTFKCHPKVKSIICIICEEVHHLSDCIRLKNIKLLSGIFAIYNKHGNLTSKFDKISFDPES